MNSEQARELFDLAVDAGLDGPQRAEFEQALAADADLKLEYERHRQVLASTRAMGQQAAAQVDLLAGVHQRIHERSGGRFFGDRFARSASGSRRAAIWGSMLALVLALSAVWVRCAPVEPVNPASLTPRVSND